MSLPAQLHFIPGSATQIPLDPVCRYPFLNLAQSPRILLPAYPSVGKTTHTCTMHTVPVKVATIEGWSWSIPACAEEPCNVL